MDQQGWNIVNASIAGLSAIGAAIAAWVSILVYRQQSDVGVPDVSARIEGRSLIVTVDNGTAYEWEVSELRFGKDIRANLMDRLSRQDVYGDLQPIPEPEMASLLLATSVPIGIAVYPKSAGSSSAFGRGDRKHIQVHFLTSRKRLKFKLVLRSLEGRPRKRVVAIKRTLIDNNPIATD